MTVILGQMFTGVSIGAVLLLIALGLSLTFGQMNLIIFAHGVLIMDVALS
ncbi:urea ABC transporter permease subunit UrtB, partial [Streptomyces sp. NPDC058272]